MKRLGLIVFALVAMAIAAPVILIATLPTAKVTIVAIRPTGRIITCTNAFGEVVGAPEWLFGITNVGRANGVWSVSVYSRQSNHPDVVTGGVVPAWLQGVSLPNEGFVTNMIVPPGDQTEWSAWLQYNTQPTPFQSHLWHLRFKTPGLRRLLPQRTIGSDSMTDWRPATNAPLASSTATNTP
jgi:hypothetical protein